MFFSADVVSADIADSLSKFILFLMPKKEVKKIVIKHRLTAASVIKKLVVNCNRFKGFLVNTANTLPNYHN